MPDTSQQTERTHEENQERAYIAASRRSDRSLEARVESARRASEIHKRRTGRSLRVTEQDVINEEMYEEEDDDLPLQYRRLTAHLQTGSADFNRRLSAYLTNHVAMRSALEQTINNSYAQQFPQAQQFQQQQFPSPMMYQQQNSFRQQPYPQRMQVAGMVQSMHQRSASIATPAELNRTAIPNNVVSANDHRRMSVPTPPTKVESPVQVRTPVSISSDTPKTRPVVHQTTKSSQQQKFTSPYNMASFENDFAGFTTALPAESQSLLGGTLDPNNPMTSMFMAGSEIQPQYTFNPSLPFTHEKTINMGKKADPLSQPIFEGLNSTLIRSQLVVPRSLNVKDEQDQQFDALTSFFDMTSGDTSDNANDTPGGNSGWDLFMENDKWDIPSGSQ